MKQFLLSIFACVILASSLAAKIEVTFDDIPPSRPLPKGYGGITWTDGWYSLKAVAPYTAHSGTRNAAPIYKGSGSGLEGGERQFQLEHAVMGGVPMGQGFLGLWIAGVGTVNGKPQTARLKMYSGYDWLVATSKTVTITPNTPVFIFSGYTGSVTKVGVEVNAGIRFFAIDDVTLISDGQWTERRTYTPNGWSMAYDQKHKEMVAFGGLEQETWTWDGARWSRRNPTRSPSTVQDCGVMTYDSVRGVVVLFGGGDYACDETWTWDGKNWTQKKPVTKPPGGRSRTAMTFDAAHGVAVLFGGCGGSGCGEDNETWTWNGSNWTQRFPKKKPLPRYYHSLAYDPIRKQVVLFGGSIDTGDYRGGTNDTWTWDGVNWTDRSTYGSPWPRWNHAMAWDGNSGSILLFGGEARDIFTAAAVPYDDTWVWNGAIWRCQPRKSAPPPKGGEHPLVTTWDSDRKETVMLVEAYPADYRTWIWKGHPPDAAAVSDP